ncbi:MULTISPECIES: phosphatase PAP2 family protein [unclassified Streptomyces]|uniref:phosphatase PAP2 family protein n=1 Tax=unclassified Streptomyces TaxID=2593676 RepID=UPI002DD948C3|nr:MULTISPECIES: phosphatase PAP2 family protein [unclassified Streptomyces]WSF82198.1 phosphatase PAP2 family protein [Streptomyces sp. NBC_01744]WSC41506.1 phosphatase PAP2 family protein [Streptomyces sp. NBC_01763]WSC49893.1 phosphatase PAP2 family protein [Streptomyces sp. NBC_01762]WSC51345.1 phosphatase PAP2 family protein [Streptomyces sp. NBC_01761]WSD29473.1 phosphatase PAP2 family protein [Streptomyces sp. NBC_01751]
MVGVAALGFLIALEIAARRYGLPGPITNQVREVIYAPKSGFLLYAGMALMMVALTWRQRFIAVAAAIGIDVAFLVVRWAVDAKMTDGHPFGNGALWVLLGYAVIAVTRRTGRERVLLLKGVGLGLLLVAGRKTGDTWLLITSKTRPAVLDQYVATADHALGNPSWLVGRIVTATGPIGFNFLDIVYGQLAVAAVIVALYQLRNVAVERRFPGHHLVRTFLVIGLLGPAIYMIFPVVGPIFAYGSGAGHWATVSLWSETPPSEQWAVANLWPGTPPPINTPHHMPFDEITPRNCMPSLHTAWATAIFIHSRTGPRLLRIAGTFWLIATLCATLGFGYHYGADLIAGVVFTLTIEAALRSLDRGWDRSGIQLVACGTTVFAALLVSYRYLPLEMAKHPWVYGPILMLATTSVVYGYVRTNALSKPRTALARQPEPQPGLRVVP